MKGALSTLLRRPKVAEKMELAPDQMLKARFTTATALLKTYAEHLQRVESKPESAVRVAVLDLANSFIKEYSFGQMFIQEISSHISELYMNPVRNMKETLVQKSGISEEVVNSMMDDFHEKGLKEDFSMRFSRIFEL